MTKWPIYRFVRFVLRLVLPARLYHPAVDALMGAVAATQRTILSVRRGLIRRYRYPRLLSIFLTTRCNLRCFICRREDFKGEDVDFANIVKLKTAIRNADAVELTGWGECLIFPQLRKVLEYVYSANPSENLIQITTNGTKLSREVAEMLTGHLRQLAISLNAATAATYNRDMKNGDFERTLSGIREFLSTLTPADRRKIRLHFVAHALNYQEIPAFVMLAVQLGVPNVSIGHYLVGHPDHVGFSLYWIKDEYNRAVDEGRRLAIQRDISFTARSFGIERAVNVQRCASPFNECYVLTNGEVSPCCYSGTFSIPNVYDLGFEKVWFGKTYGRLRKKRFLPVCQHCAQFLPLDDYRAHFTTAFKESAEFAEWAGSHASSETEARLE
jgi:MoaA/NifB/PqqE/SkfB family radical SAM enzyme